MADRKRLHLRRDDACAQCGLPLPAGTEAYWLRTQRHVLCISCGAAPTAPVTDAAIIEPAPPPSTPGASARKIHEQKRRVREQRQRERYGRIGGWAARMSAGPQHERAWARGAAGEEANAKRLHELLADKPVVLLHDRRMLRSRANIDHLAVGPGGVTVIDSKKLKGKVRVDWSGGLLSPRKFDLYVNNRRRTNLVEGVERQVEAVQEVLTEDGFGTVSVLGALCMADPENLPLFKHLKIRGVPIEGTRHVAKLAARDGALTGADIQRIADILIRRLPST